MANLYISSFDDNNVTRYGIFDVWGDKPQLYTEDFQPLVFDSEEEAKARLAAIDAEKERSDKAIPFSMEDAKKYAESHFWKFASDDVVFGQIRPVVSGLSGFDPRDLTNDLPILCW